MSTCREKSKGTRKWGGLPNGDLGPERSDLPKATQKVSSGIKTWILTLWPSVIFTGHLASPKRRSHTI